MKDNDIILSINKWNELVNKKDEKSAAMISSFFENCGNCFSYVLDKNSENTKVLHAYPGIFEDKLYYFVIPAKYDNANFTGSFHKYTTVCPVYYNLESNRIPESEAKARIKNWDHNYKTWIPSQVISEVGMFRVFTIDTIDFEFEKSLVNFGLVLDKLGKLDRADLIVTNMNDSQVVYDDYSVPVPPYGPAAAETNFYLLNPVL
jgi:hypothetical protein